MTFLDFVSQNSLTINLALSLVVFGLAARIFAVPHLTDRRLVVGILLLHAMRHLGLMFLSNGATQGAMPLGFAAPAALGDLLTSVLALVALPLVLNGSVLAVPALWLFNGVGAADLIFAVSQGFLLAITPFTGATYWIVALWVPAMFVTHYLLFLALWRGLPVRAKARSGC